jgi:hypothetical protein
MELCSLLEPTSKIQIFVLGNIQNSTEYVKLINRDDICILNPELIINLTHISITFEKSVQAMIKKKSSHLSKKDLIYYSCDSSKLENCLQQHNFGAVQLNSILIIINSDKKYLDDDFTSLLKCEVYDVTKIPYFTKFDKLEKEFGITNSEKSTSSGIIGGIYNRLSLKDLK